MSELQLGLVVIGALVVVGVLAYNRVQERSAQRSADAAFRSRHPDALLRDTQLPEEAPGRTAEPRHRPGEAHDAARGGALPDARLDYVIELDARDEVGAVAVRELWATPSRRLRDRTLLSGSSDGKAWRQIGQADTAKFARLRAGLQLVSRAGVIGEAELIEFRSEVETMAARLGAQVQAPEMKAALESARALDAFCAERDIQVALHVVSRAPEGFDRKAVIALGGRFGLAVDPRGGLSCRDPADRLLYAAADRSGARLDAPGPVASPVLALSLVMDVPRAPDTRRTFEAMARLAATLAAEIGGTVVDDNDAALDERALAAIGAQLDQVRSELEARGIAPGEALALRLFS